MILKYTRLHWSRSRFEIKHKISQSPMQQEVFKKKIDPSSLFNTFDDMKNIRIQFKKKKRFFSHYNLLQPLKIIEKHIFIIKNYLPFFFFCSECLDLLYYLNGVRHSMLRYNVCALNTRAVSVWISFLKMKKKMLLNETAAGFSIYLCVCM